MLIEEISFREWLICKIRYWSGRKHLRRRKMFHARQAGDRRDEVEGECFASNERRRRPERRIPEVREISFDEFERWKNRLNSR